jgi:hypothetical protein
MDHAGPDKPDPRIETRSDFIARSVHRQSSRCSETTDLDQAGRSLE